MRKKYNTPHRRHVAVSYTHLRALQESAALFSFLQANCIQSMQQLHEKIADMNSRYYDLRGKIVKAERRITTPVSYTHLDVYKRQHQNYLKRKASGAQKRYEDKIKAKKKAEMDAKKALIRAEDMKKGIFSTVGQLPKEEPRKGSIAANAAV